MQAPASLHAVTSVSAILFVMCGVSVTPTQVHAPFSKFLITCHDDAVWGAMEAREHGVLLRQLLAEGETSDADLVKRYGPALCSAASA
jgi:hypothetical protein